MNPALLPHVYFRAIKAGKCVGMAWESCCVNDDNKISTLIVETLTPIASRKGLRELAQS